MQTLPPINSNLSRAETLQAIRRFFTDHKNKYPYIIQSYVAYHFFRKIHENYMAKSKGGVDEFGDSWKPLSPTTIAAKARGARFRNRTNRKRPTLNSTQDKQWRGIFASQTARGVSPAEAGRLAWAVLKSRGAKTLIMRYGNRKVPINIDTGRLQESLKPGTLTNDRYGKHNKDQVVIVRSRTRIAFGTKVPYAEHVQKVRPFFYSATDTKPWIDQGIINSLEPLTAKLEEELQ